MTVPAADNLRPLGQLLSALRTYGHVVPGSCACDRCIAADLLEAIDARHYEGELERDDYTGLGYSWCEGCGEEWPCTEHRMLHPDLQ